MEEETDRCLNLHPVLFSCFSEANLGGEGLSLSAMAAYQSVGLLSLKIQLSVSVFRCLIRGGADASPKSLSSRLHETRH